MSSQGIFCSSLRASAAERGLVLRPLPRLGASARLLSAGRLALKSPFLPMQRQGGGCWALGTAPAHPNGSLHSRRCCDGRCLPACAARLLLLVPARPPWPAKGQRFLQPRPSGRRRAGERALEPVWRLRAPVCSTDDAVCSFASFSATAALQAQAEAGGRAAMKPCHACPAPSSTPAPCLRPHAPTVGLRCSSRASTPLARCMHVFVRVCVCCGGWGRYLCISVAASSSAPWRPPLLSAESRVFPGLLSPTCRMLLYIVSCHLLPTQTRLHFMPLQSLHCAALRLRSPLPLQGRS